MLEILPGEVGNIIVPRLDDIPIKKVREVLTRVDSFIRKGDDIEKVLDIVDNEILVSLLGIDDIMCKDARIIWKKMQNRRLKRGWN